MDAINSGTVDSNISRVAEATEVQPSATNFNTDANVALPEGLTPQQGRAAILLASGMDIQDVADQLGVHRTTLWHWRKLETFQALMNALFIEARQNALNRLMSLQAEAMAAVARILENGSDSTALKAACYVLEQASDIQLRSTDPRELVQQSCSSDLMDALIGVDELVLDEHAYRERCEELGIEP